MPENINVILTRRIIVMDQNIPFSQWPEVPDYDMGEPFYQEGVK